MRLLVSPLHALDTICAEHRPSHLVSWLSSPAASPDVARAFAPDRRLLLCSHDISAPTEGFQAPTREDVARLLGFARGWSGERPLLTHCWAGVSRSTAAAYGIACALSAKSEWEIAQALRAASPGATPNPLIVRHADDLLGREGRMVAALAEIGRGAEVSLGAPIELTLR